MWLMFLQSYIHFEGQCEIGTMLKCGEIYLQPVITMKSEADKQCCELTRQGCASEGFAVGRDGVGSRGE